MHHTRAHLKLVRRKLDDHTHEFIVLPEDANGALAAWIITIVSLATTAAAALSSLSLAAKALVVVAVLALCVDRWMEVKSESITVLKHVGVTLESVRRCGTVSSTFIDIERVRAVIINEAVSTTCVRFYLAFLLYQGDAMAVAFPNLLPRIHVLRPVYEQLQELVCTPREAAGVPGPLQPSGD